MLILLSLFVYSSVVAQDFVVNWEFDGEDPGRWVAAHGFSPAIVSDGVLKTTVTGGDPYLVGPGCSFSAPSSPVVLVRMKSEGTEGLAIYFTTESEPGFNAPMHVGFPVLGDKEWHVYRLDMGSSSSLWRGEITTLRLDIDGWPMGTTPELKIDWIRIPVLARELKTSFLNYPGLPIKEGDEFSIVTETTNSGGEPEEKVNVFLKYPGGMKVRFVEGLLPGQRVRHDWGSVSLGNPVTQSIVTGALTKDGEEYSESVSVVVLGDSDVTSAQMLESGHHLISSHGMRMWFFASDDALEWQRSIIEIEKDGSHVPVCWLAPMPEVVIASDDIRGELLEWRNEGSHQGNDFVALFASSEDSRGRTWQAESRFSVDAEECGESDGVSIQVSASVSCSERAEFLRFGFPRLEMGRGSFGAKKEEAILPGLEWLVADEISSSTLDSHPPLNLRRIPHPYKVTIPVMSMRTDGILTSLHWDPLHADRKGSSRIPQPEFQSPEIDRDYHVMGLSLPSVAQGLAENSRLAVVPLEISTGENLILAATIQIQRTNDSLAGVKKHVGELTDGVRDRWPRSLDEERALCRKAWLDTRWVPERKGWLNAWSNPAGPNAEMIQVLMTDRSLGVDSSVEGHLTEVIDAAFEECLRLRGLKGLGFPACLTLGGVLESLAHEEEGLRNLIATQSADGGWTFSPTDRNKDLGNPGDEAIGLNTWNIYRLLRHARVTGDKDMLKAGLRGLEYVKKFHVPRAAQIWEIPVHSPDILASGHACLAYSEGYRLTGNENYLQLARYWAETGLPFIYSWNLPDKPFMHGATIPIFGSTHYAFGWYGQPVQWCGLAYASALLDFSEIDDSLDWRSIAEAITVSGMYQQYQDGDAAGTYPDFRNVISDNTALYLNPSSIFRNLLVLEGHSINWETTPIESSDGNILRVTTRNKIGRTSLSRSGQRLTFQLERGLPLAQMIFLSNVRQPKRVTVGRKPLQKTEHYSDRGYRYDPERRWLVLQLEARQASKIILDFE